MKYYYINEKKIETASTEIEHLKKILLHLPHTLGPIDLLTKLFRTNWLFQLKLK